MKSYENFYAYLQELCGSYGDLAGLIRQKMEAVSLLDVARLENIMKEEQAFVLLSKGFDQAVSAFKTDLGLSGNTLRELLPQMPQQERPRFEAVHQELSLILADVKNLNEKCQELLGDHLHVVEKQLRELSGSPTSTYGKGGSKGQSAAGQPRMLTKSV
ncbi:flagellar protein FlgN [Oscillospiraceae bacterium MB08-C2-2]|nr:flagellar protein FlgN [Oscillospiraceae bacterium MB08-C2-2]